MTQLTFVVSIAAFTISCVSLYLNRIPGPIGPQGPKGETGAKGTPGDVGPPAVIPDIPTRAPHRISQTRIRREDCSVCKRQVWKFEDIDGKIVCTDCILKGAGAKGK